MRVQTLSVYDRIVTLDEMFTGRKSQLHRIDMAVGSMCIPRVRVRGVVNF
jgi:hypothetical protein